MKKTVLRLSLVSALSLVISACSFSKDALFPSLVGSDSQEEIKTRGTNIVDLDGNALQYRYLCRTESRFFPQ